MYKLIIEHDCLVAHEITNSNQSDLYPIHSTEDIIVLNKAHDYYNDVKILLEIFNFCVQSFGDQFTMYSLSIAEINNHALVAFKIPSIIFVPNSRVTVIKFKTSEMKTLFTIKWSNQ